MKIFHSKVDAMKKVIVIAATMWLFTQVLATAQETPPPIEDSSPIPTTTGTVTSFVAGQSISIDTSPTVHLTFPLARVLEIIGSDGNPANAEAVTSGRTVTLHFIIDYDNLIVDRILLGQQ